MTFKPLINGVIQITGDHDTGKTTMALECGADPSRICFFDGDVKGRATVDQLISDGVEFPEYHDLNALAEDKNEIEFFLACMELIDDIKPGDHDVIIWDTWGRFGKTFHPYVVANPTLFRKKWSPSGKIKGAEQWQEAQQYEARVLNRLGKLAPLVIIVSHLKAFYLNNAKTDKEIPASSRTFRRVPRFRIWLRHNPDSPVPIGLVLKRVDKKIFVKGKGLRTISILPKKIVPASTDESLWDSIGRYFEEPVGLRAPTPDETPNPFEMSILDGTLTREQKYTLELMLKAGVIDTEDSEIEAETNDLKTYVADMRSQGATDEYIAKSLKDQGEGYKAIAGALGVKVPEAIKLCREES